MLFIYRLMFKRDSGPTDAYMVSLGEPSEHLLAGFPDAVTELSRSGIIKNYTGKGIETRVYINFGEGGGLYN